jgi:hypothetical protein
LAVDQMAGKQFLCHVVPHNLPSPPEATEGFCAC